MNDLERLFKIKSCGSRDITLKIFSQALNEWKQGKTKEFPLLLVDSEGPVQKGVGPWAHLKTRDGWGCPAGAVDDHAHLMAQCMETWFLADVTALEIYFGRNFDVKSLPKTVPLEEAAKEDVATGLDRAAAGTPKKGYNKGRDSFTILERVDPLKVQAKAPWACRLFKTLDDKLARNQTTTSARTEESIRSCKAAP
ncbi:MAG: DUF4276 family protein [Magnetococcus sp. DMHC-1]